MIGGAAALYPDPPLVTSTLDNCLSGEVIGVPLIGILKYAA